LNKDYHILSRNVWLVPRAIEERKASTEVAVSGLMLIWG